MREPLNGSSWYAVGIAPGGLMYRHTRLERTHLRLESRARLRGAGPLGFPAEEILKRHGYVPFIPTESIFIRHNAFHSGMKKRVRRAIIPCLAFLRMADGVNWAELLSVPMVTGVFGVAGVPRRFREHEIARLRAMSDDLRQPEYFAPMPTRKGYHVGDQVRDMQGRFDVPLRVLAIEGETARVLGTMFGAEYEMTAQVSNLAKWA